MLIEVLERSPTMHAGLPHPAPSQGGLSANAWPGSGRDGTTVPQRRKTLDLGERDLDRERRCITGLFVLRPGIGRHSDRPLVNWLVNLRVSEPDGSQRVPHLLALFGIAERPCVVRGVDGRAMPGQGLGRPPQAEEAASPRLPRTAEAVEKLG